MLSIKKVKIHGLKDHRWTNADKVQQYKGVINLYKRDQKIVKVDNMAELKKYEKDIKFLKKNIMENRLNLDNAIYGDKQIIRNILAEYNEFRLAFRDLDPIMIIEHVHQNTFNKRKMLDLLNHEIQVKTDELIELKLKASVLEDRLKYDIFGKLPVELQAAAITGKVQDAILKREAAVVVQHSYKAILDVMKKDHDYMFQVLEALQEDAKDQARCMYNTTTLGQLATEYLDDRRREFKELETDIKSDMKVRQEDLQEVRQQVEKIDKQIKRLIRRDSDITLTFNHKAFINKLSEESLDTENQLKELHRTINYLTETTLVSNYTNIFPCIKEQFKQSERLKRFTTDLQIQRDGLFEKVKHAHQMYKNLTFAKGTSRYAYENEKQRLLDLINEEKERERHANEHNIYKSEVILKVRIALQRIEELVVLVVNPKNKKAMYELEFTSDFVHEQPKDIIDTLEGKLINLVQCGEVFLKPDQEYTSFNQMQKILENTTCSIDTSAKITDVSLIEGITFEDPSVPSRQDIKKISQEIVKANTKLDESELKPPPKKKKFKFKK